MPYEICVNALTGETTSRKLVSKPFGTTGGSSNPIPIIFGKSVSGTYPATGIRRTGVVAGSYENFNSESRFRAYGGSNFPSFSPSTSGIYSLPSLVHANLNAANGQKQYAKVPTASSFSNCDDDIGSAANYIFLLFRYRRFEDIHEYIFFIFSLFFFTCRLLVPPTASGRSFSYSCVQKPSRTECHLQTRKAICTRR